MKLLHRQLNLSLIPKWIPILLLIVVIIGFADSTYLTVEHYQNKIPPCTIGGCESVLSSKYAVVLGIPVALGGAIYYLVLVAMLFLFLDTKREIYFRIPLLVSFVGLLCSIWFSYLQAFVIRAFCPYCAVSGVASLILFGFAIYLLKYKSNE